MSTHLSFALTICLIEYWRSENNLYKGLNWKNEPSANLLALPSLIALGSLSESLTVYHVPKRTMERKIEEASLPTEEIRPEDVET